MNQRRVVESIEPSGALALVRTLTIHFHRYRHALIALAAVSIATAAVETASLVSLVPLAAAIGSDDGRYDGSLAGIDVSVGVGALVVLALTLVVLRGTGAVAVRAIEARLLSRYEYERRHDGFRAFLDAEWSLQAQERPGYVESALSVYVARGQGVLRAFAMGLTSFVGLAIVVVGALALGGLAALGAAVAVIVISLITTPFLRASRRHFAELVKLTPTYANHVVEAVGLAREIRAFGAGDSVARSSEVVLGDLRQHRFWAQYLTSITPSIFETSGLLALIGGLGLVYLVGPSDLTGLAAMAMLLIRALMYGRTLQSQYQQVTNQVPYIVALDKIIERYEAARSPAEGVSIDQLDSIRFEAVSFGYRSGIPVLSDVACSIERGDSIGVIGPSGSGKSTFLQLLLRLRRPDSGALLANGIDVRQFSLASWYRAVSLVPQDPAFFNMSIIDNVRFFRDWISDVDVEESLRLAHIWEEVCELPDGWNTAVGERGSELSGGQRQRLAIARALAGRPDMILFDEPTASLDVHSEALIQKSLGDLKTDTTLVIVAHRLSTLQQCDLIMVFRQGRLQAFGPRSELEVGNPYYSEALTLSRLE